VTLKTADNTVIATTTTDSYGKYKFEGLCAGTYKVEVETPYGLELVKPNAPGTTTSNDSNTNPSNVTLSTSSSTDLTVDFGFKKAKKYVTYTQGGWGSPPNGNNPGSLLKNKFSYVLGSYVTIGGTKYLKFTSAYAIERFLPQGGTPNKLLANATDPTTSAAGVFAGQVLALKLNVEFSNKGVTETGLGSLKLKNGYCGVASCPLQGKTVNEILAIANSVLGGGALPAGVASISVLNDIVDKINNNFDNGANNGLLVP
jgi:hypothetical protein